MTGITGIKAMLYFAGFSANLPQKRTATAPFGQSVSGDPELERKLNVVRKVVQTLEAELKKGPVRFIGVDTKPVTGFHTITFDMGEKRYILSTFPSLLWRGSRLFEIRAADRSLILGYHDTSKINDAHPSTLSILK